jgi:LmbE family N-acetylglucosaminyl deacetylase
MDRALLAVLAHPDDESFAIGGTLSRYAREGVDVHVAIATDGIAGSVVEEYESVKDQLVAVRTRELTAAVNVLGGKLHMFCYRDSGYLGDPANQHPDAFINADETEAIGRVVKLIREVRPQVVITHDETGGYYHPDHVMCWKITTPAFFAAGDPEQYADLGLDAYQPQRLYYTAFPNRFARIYAFFMRLRGQDPTRVGRNKDIDLTRIGLANDQIHAYVDIRHSWDAKVAAGAQHVSQGGAAGPNRLVPAWLQRRLFGRETFMRAYPPVQTGFREYGLFDGLEVDPYRLPSRIMPQVLGRP